MKKKVIILCSFCLVILIGAIVADRIMAKSNLIEIKYKEVMKKIENKETFILLVSQTFCDHCKEYKPKLDKVAKKNDLKVYYIEFDLFSDEEKKEFTKYVNFESTPVTIFLKDGEETSAATRISGGRDEEYILAKLKSNGFVSE